MTVKSILEKLFFSFPVQLFLLQLKKNHFFLFFWLIFFGMVTQNVGKGWGIPYLFLDPEYMGKVGFRSFFIMGIACGGFIMTFHISNYILNGFRFPFLAALSRPFFKYMINNSILPLTFTLVYLSCIIHFQLFSEFQSRTTVLFYISGFIAGLILVSFITITYFFTTNKDIFKILGVKSGDELSLEKIKKKRGSKHTEQKGKDWRVDTYLSNPFKIRLTRPTEHYDKTILMKVFKQNHLNAAFIETIVFLVIIILGLFRENKYFQIPAGASLFLLFSMLVMLSSAFRFWLRGWATTSFLILFIILNFFSRFEFFYQRNHAFGMNYWNEKAAYNFETLKHLTSKENYDADAAVTMNVLEKWKKKAGTGISAKPKIIFINTSGGGVRSAIWTYRTMQVADSLLNGELFKYTHLISGSSGGMIGASYFREIFLQHQSGRIKNYRSDEYLSNIGKDILNPVGFSLIVSDLFFSIQKFSDGKYRYRKDRAYAFERQLNENTGYLLDKRLSDYREPEEKSLIPMMILNPTIVDDSRRIFMSPLPVAYLTRKVPEENFSFIPISEGVEFMRMFAKQDAGNIKFTSALRINSTFPYITPTVSLPSDPMISVMDAGARDNFGVMTSLKFLYVFRKWILENTSEVIFIQIRDTYKEAPMEKKPQRTIVDNIISPLGSFYGNFAKVQDYNNDELFQYASAWYPGKLQFITFELPTQREKLSLSWHLTTREKNFIYNAINLPENQLALSQLKAAFGF